MRSRSLVLLTATVLALAAAGCGGDDEEPATTTDVAGATGVTGGDGPAEPVGDVDRASFIDRADEICRVQEQEQTDELEALFPAGPDDASPDEIALAAEDVVIPSLRAQLDGLRELTPPAGDEPRVARILATLEEGIEELEANPESLAEGETDAIDRAATLAQGYGFTECGS